MLDAFFLLHGGLLWPGKASLGSLFFPISTLVLSIHESLFNLENRKAYPTWNWKSVRIALFWFRSTCMSFGLTDIVQADHHHHSKRGQLPISTCAVQELGDVHSVNTFVKRDLGFHGRIGNNIFLSYGDTMYSDSNYSDKFRGMTSDSIALATRDPLEVMDINLSDQGYPQQFCPIMVEYGEDPSTYALGITNVIETSPGQGAESLSFREAR
jgi:hypothetical protein